MEINSFYVDSHILYIFESFKGNFFVNIDLIPKFYLQFNDIRGGVFCDSHSP